jgi:hypothetical protein
MNIMNFYTKAKTPIKNIFLILGKVYSFILVRISRMIEPYLQFKYSDIAQKAMSHLITTIISVFLAYLTIFKIIPTVVVFSYELVVISTMAKTDTFIFSKTDEVEAGLTPCLRLSPETLPSPVRLGGIPYRRQSVHGLGLPDKTWYSI